jgi:hypothetical protein
VTIIRRKLFVTFFLEKVTIGLVIVPSKLQGKVAGHRGEPI